MKRVANLFFVCLLLWGLYACDDDDSGPLSISVVSISGTGTDLQSGNNTTVDLNGASAATDVPLDVSIEITFSRDIDVSTVNSTNISLNGGSANPAINVTGSGSVATVTLQGDLERGEDYTLNLSGAILADDGGAFAATTRTFTAAGRAGIDPPNTANQTAYWQFDGTALAAVGGFNGTETAITYGTDRFGNIESAALFDGNTSLIEVANGEDLWIGESVTISFWMSIDTLDHLNTPGTGNAGHFIMGVGNFHGFFLEANGSANSMKLAPTYSTSDGMTGGGDVFFNGDGKDGSNGGFVAIEFEKDLTAEGEVKGLLAQKWAHVVWVYDGIENKVHLYINGELMETDNNNLVAARQNYNGLTVRDEAGQVIGRSLAFGFAHDMSTTTWEGTGFGDYTVTTANHYKGSLDDVRFFEVPFSATDVMDLFIAESN